MVTPSGSILFPSVVFFLLLTVTPTPALSAGKCNKQDKKALLAIAAHFGHFDNRSILASWTDHSACCEWAGVGCDDVTGRVNSFGLLDGYLSGTIPPAIGDLPYLKQLVFSQMTDLVGSIPSTTTKLTRLDTVLLSLNSLSGPIPPFLSQLTSLTFLDLSHNKFSGSIPPTLGSLRKLVTLRLNNNRLTGPIPDTLGNLSRTHLIYLDFSNNKLSGLFPVTLAAPRWTDVDLSGNQLSGDASVLLAPSKAITSLVISNNRFEFNLSKVRFPMGLKVLNMDHNKIYGRIPKQINEMPKLMVVDMSYNSLCGEIPAGKVTAELSPGRVEHNKCLCGAPLPACK